MTEAEVLKRLADAGIDVDADDFDSMAASIALCSAASLGATPLQVYEYCRRSFMRAAGDGDTGAKKGDRG